MYYLKCKHCNHLNEVKSEYMVVCGLCNRKLEDNFKDWKVRHPEKTFEDFQREVCLTEEQVKKGDLSKPAGKKNKKGIIAGAIGALLMVLFIGLLVGEFTKTYKAQFGGSDVPVLEQQWYTGSYAGGVSLTTPKAMKSAGAMLRNRLPEEIQALIKEMDVYSYSGYGVDLMFMFSEYVPEVGKADLEGAAEGALNDAKNQRGVFDFKNDKAYAQMGDMIGIVMQGTFVKGGTEYEFNITIYADGLKLYQLVSSNKKGDDIARGVVRRIYDSFKVAGHEESKTE